MRFVYGSTSYYHGVRYLKVCRFYFVNLMQCVGAMSLVFGMQIIFETGPGAQLTCEGIPGSAHKVLRRGRKSVEGMAELLGAGVR